MEVKKTMDANELRSLQESYLEVVEGQQLDEAITSEKGKAKAAEMIAKRTTASGRAKSGQGANVARIKHISRSNVDGYGATPSNLKVAKNPVKSNFTGLNSGTGNKAKRRAEALKKEEVDIYDIILSHLLDEGYAETQEAAESIMVNMSEEWRDSIVEADSLAAMQARREKRLARQRKQMGTSSTGQDFGHDYGISSAERKKRQQAEFDKFVGKKTKK